jgi:hypothetical protein
MFLIHGQGSSASLEIHLPTSIRLNRNLKIFATAHSALMQVK